MPVMALATLQYSGFKNRLNCTSQAMMPAYSDECGILFMLLISIVGGDIVFRLSIRPCMHKSVHAYGERSIL